MPTSRRSKRLASNEPLAEKPLKRVHKPNSQTIDAFLKSQTPVQPTIRPQNTKRRRNIKASKLQKASRPSKKAPTTPIPISSTLSSPPPTESAQNTPLSLPQTKRTNAPTPSSPFDPKEEGKAPHNVSLIITLIIDDSRKTNYGICLNINLNFIYRELFKDLKQIIYNKYIKL